MSSCKCTIDYRRTENTPILFKLDNLQQVEDPLLPERISDLDRPIYLAPRYYLKIFSPTNNIGPQTGQHIIYRIPHSGTLADTVRLILKPSNSLSANSSYLVEYWQWNKILYPEGYNDSKIPKSRVTSKDLPVNTKKLIKTEYWNIPIVRTNSTLNLRRVDSNPDFPNCDYLYTDKVLMIEELIDENQTEWFDYTIRNLSYRPYIESLTNEEVTTAIAISWGQSLPRPNTHYTITYPRPISYKDIIFTPEQNVRAGDRYGSYLPHHHNHSHYPYITESHYL